MSRARNIKPGFFTNGDLLECSPLSRLLFAGLWCEADRRGILEDRPKTIKVKVLPGDDCDIDALLAELAGKGFIERYEVDGIRCLYIPNFGKHQNPHVREQASSLPAPGEHSASTGQDMDKPGTSPADSLLLIPDSPIQVPPVVPPPSEPPKSEPPKQPDPKPRTDRQQAADALYERRRVIFEAYCRGLGVETDSLPATQRKSRAFNALTVPILDTPECEAATVEALTRYTTSAFEWRNGKKTPELFEVLAAFPEWDQAGRPEKVDRQARAPTPIRQATGTGGTPLTRDQLIAIGNGESLEHVRNR